jgi:hypothetical protein
MNDPIGTSTYNGRFRAITGESGDNDSAEVRVGKQALLQAVNDLKILCGYGLVTREGHRRNARPERPSQVAKVFLGWSRAATLRLGQFSLPCTGNFLAHCAKTRSKEMSTWIEDQSELSVRYRAEVAALNEEIDRLLAALRVQQENGRKVLQLEEKVRNLTVALDDALAIVRARNAIRAQEEEAGL